MQLTKTIILKLDCPDNDLAEMLSIFSQGMNYASQIIFANEKPMGSNIIQKASYRYLRNELGLKSQMCCNVARQAAGASKLSRNRYASGNRNGSSWSLVRLVQPSHSNATLGSAKPL